MCTYVYVLFYPVELGPSCLLHRQYWSSFKCCSLHVVNMLILYTIPTAPVGTRGRIFT
jgi:DUF1680 family protein